MVHILEHICLCIAVSFLPAEELRSDPVPGQEVVVDTQDGQEV